MFKHQPGIISSLLLLIYMQFNIAYASPPGRQISTETGTFSTIIVNGVPVPEADVNREMERLAPVGVYHNLSPETLENIRNKAIENLIDLELFYREALKQGVAWDETWVVDRFQKTREKYKDNPELYDVMGEEEVKMRLMTDLRKAYVISKFMRYEKESLNVTETQIKQFYEKNKDNYKSPLTVKVKEVLFKLPAHSTKNDWDEAQLAADRLYEYLMKGNAVHEFEDKGKKSLYQLQIGDRVIHENSGDKTYANVLVLKPGEISKPFFTIYGLVVMQVKEITKPALFDFGLVADSVRQDVINYQYREKISNLKESLKKNASIVIGTNLNNVKR